MFRLPSDKAYAFVQNNNFGPILSCPQLVVKTKYIETSIKLLG